MLFSSSTFLFYFSASRRKFTRKGKDIGPKPDDNARHADLPREEPT